nr:coat protein [Vicia cryptic virus]
MEAHTPAADVNGPNIPSGAVSQPEIAPHNQAAPNVSGAAQAIIAPTPARKRTPHGPIPAATSSGNTSAPALLELAAAYPMYTEQRRSFNFFIPDSQMMFHSLGICDSMMNSTDRFLRSSPAWLPIVSQLYISVLWNVMIIRILSHTGYAPSFTDLLNTLTTDLQIEECMVPGPLVPFFQSLASINGPFDWIGDITPALPGFDSLWDATNFTPHASYTRFVPIPAILLDQLYYCATYVGVNQGDLYPTFTWYRNIFTRTGANTPALLRMGPNLCGSLFTTSNQFDAARTYWRACFGTGFTRVNVTAAAFTDYLQLLGLRSQTGEPQTAWFQNVTMVMQKYAQHFNGSVPLKSIDLTGIGAVALTGTPVNNTAVRDWLYPPNANIEPFTTGRFNPRREIPAQLRVRFSHSDHELELQAEQYAIAAHTNIRWAANIAAQHERTAINPAHLHQGDYWNMTPFRHTGHLGLKTQYAQLIASRYHQLAANRVD